MNDNRIKKRTILSCLMVIGVLLYFAYHSSVPVEQPNRHIVKRGWAYDFKYPFIFNMKSRVVNVVVEHQFHWELIQYDYTVVPSDHRGLVIDIKTGAAKRELAPGSYYIDRGVERVATIDIGPYVSRWGG